MSVSVGFKAVIPVDGDTYRKHKAVLDACEHAGVTLPEATRDFFASGDVHEHGVEVHLSKYGKGSPVQGDPEYGDGALVDLSRLPPGTTHIRVYMS